jgi:hypothetical protein
LVSCEKYKSLHYIMCLRPDECSRLGCIQVCIGSGEKK